MYWHLNKYKEYKFNKNQCNWSYDYNVIVVEILNKVKFKWNYTSDEVGNVNEKYDLIMDSSV